MNIPSKQYAQWHKEALKQDQLIAVRKEFFQLSNVRVSLSFWAPDKRKTDLSNRAESVMDLLVDSGILEDDNWWVVDELNLKLKGIDRTNPRCEITITRNNPNGTHGE